MLCHAAPADADRAPLIAPCLRVQLRVQLTQASASLLPASGALPDMLLRRSERCTQPEPGLYTVPM
jgi:hypothetical protein